MTVDEMMKLADQATGHYTRRCWWADPRDIRQEALAAMLRALETYDPERGDRSAYLARAAVIAVRNWLWAFSSPVKQRPDRNLGAYYAAPLDDRRSDPGPRPDRLVEMRRLRDRAVRALVPYPFGTRVLLGWRSHEVAAEERIPVERVYAETDRARRVLRAELTDYQEDT